MSNIYAGIELGTDSIKVIVMEKLADQYHVLSSACSESLGIKNSYVVDIKSAANAVKKAIKSASEMLGIKITKVIACVPPTHCKMDIVVGECEVINSKSITGEDVSNVLNEAMKDQDFSEYELVTAMPIAFRVDDVENIKDPKGKKGDILGAKIVIATMPKEELYRFLEVLKLAGVEVVDIAFTSTGDYYTIKNNRYDNIVGAIVNIGEATTNVAIYNKGIQIKNAVIPVGSSHVDKDVSYIFKINEDVAKRLKETFAVSMGSYADATDTIELKNNKDEWCRKYELAKSYYEHHGNLEVPSDFKTINGYEYYEDGDVVEEPTYRHAEDSITRFDNKSKRSKRSKRRSKDRPAEGEAVAEPMRAEPSNILSRSQIRQNRSRMQPSNLRRSSHGLSM